MNRPFYEVYLKDYEGAVTMYKMRLVFKAPQPVKQESNAIQPEAVDMSLDYDPVTARIETISALGEM